MTDYEKLVELCADMDERYCESDDPNVGFKVGHYDDRREEIMFYGVPNGRLEELKYELDKSGVHYWLWKAHSTDDMVPVLIYPVKRSLFINCVH